MDVFKNSKICEITLKLLFYNIRHCRETNKSDSCIISNGLLTNARRRATRRIDDYKFRPSSPRHCRSTMRLKEVAASSSLMRTPYFRSGLAFRSISLSQSHCSAIEVVGILQMVQLKRFRKPVFLSFEAMSNYVQSLEIRKLFRLKRLAVSSLGLRLVAILLNDG